MSKEIMKKMFEITNQVKYLSEEQIKDGLELLSGNIIKYCYAKHDKDLKDNSNELKEEHYHVFIRFNKGVRLKTVAKAFRVEEQYINTIKGKFDDAILYLTHRNSLDKYQYDSFKMLETAKSKEYMDRREIAEIQFGNKDSL